MSVSLVELATRILVIGILQQRAQAFAFVPAGSRHCSTDSVLHAKVAVRPPKPSFDSGDDSGDSNSTASKAPEKEWRVSLAVAAPDEANETEYPINGQQTSRPSLSPTRSIDQSYDEMVSEIRSRQNRVSGAGVLAKPRNSFKVGRLGNESVSVDDRSEIEGGQIEGQSILPDLSMLRHKLGNLEKDILWASEVKTNDPGWQHRDRFQSRVLNDARRQLVATKGFIGHLEVQQKAVDKALEDERDKLQRTLQERDQVSAEYDALAKSFQDMQSQLELQTSDLNTRLNESVDQNNDLGEKLNGMSEQMEMYRNKSNELAKECDEKTSRIDSLANELTQMQGIIAELRSETYRRQYAEEGREEERQRSGTKLQAMADEYDLAMREKQDKVNNLRSELRSANANLKKIERAADGQSRSLDRSMKELANSAERIESLESRLLNETRLVDAYRNESVALSQRIEEKEKVIGVLQSGDYLSEILQKGRDEERREVTDEFTSKLQEKQKKVNKLRDELRSANVKTMRLERERDRYRLEIRREVSNELSKEADALRAAIEEKDNDLQLMEKTMSESAATSLDEKERLLAEIMFQSSELKRLRVEVRSYAELARQSEEETKFMEDRISVLEFDLNEARREVALLEERIGDLTAELERERDTNAELSATVSELENKLSVVQTNSQGYEKIVEILKNETEAYKARLVGAEQDREANAELEGLLQKTRDSLLAERNRLTGALAERDSQMGQLDKELVEKSNALDKASEKVSGYERRYVDERKRADLLQEKINRLNQNAVERDGDSDLVRQLDLLSKEANDYKRLVSSYEGKVNLMSQQLLLSGRCLSDKQSLIFELRERLEDMTRQTKADTQSRSDETSNSDKEDLQTGFVDEATQLKANEKILELNEVLGEREAVLRKLQSRLKQQTEQLRSIKASQEVQTNAAVEQVTREKQRKIQSLEQEVKSLKNTAASATVRNTQHSYLQLEDALRRSKENEMKLMNRNMRMRRQIEDNNLTKQERRLQNIESKLEKWEMGASANNLPSYYREPRRPNVIKKVSGILNRLRKKN
ncbi:hypothetical protein THAOC_12975 [Thalassiosira oceanica]|uniref:Uncharacterized protein n=1 Tax=Thalassiosira oceanica TaxID=159749 RepID=K0SLA8_THAOC|nr:hypothetical protein THAOC_12975 [Thalassiosira oceanica]|eukprot:EJK66120.1 hypothetical protein THAOC_12975 [Thalassiosira oceanica]